MSAKPTFKVGDLATIDRFGFPGMPIDTPVVIVEVKKAGKRDGYQHRYRVMAESTKEAWTYEEDLRLTRDAGANSFDGAPEAAFVAVAVDHRGVVHGMWPAATVPAAIATADAKAHKAYTITIRGDRTSDGRVWGAGRGRVEAVRENGRWLRY